MIWHQKFVPAWHGPAKLTRGDLGRSTIFHPTLKSVATTCDVGNNVLFTWNHCYLMNLRSGKMIVGDRVGNTYVIEVWVNIGGKTDPNAMDVGQVESGFARPDAAR